MKSLFKTIAALTALFLFISWSGIGLAEDESSGLENLEEDFGGIKDKLKDGIYTSWEWVLGEGSKALENESPETVFELLFDQLGSNFNFDFPISQFNLGQAAVGLGINLGISRKAIPNRDVKNSYTVVDKLSLTGNASVSTYYKGIMPSIGGNLGIDFINIRRITTEGHTDLFPIEEGLRLYNNTKNVFKKVLKIEEDENDREGSERGENDIDILELNTVGEEDEPVLSFVPSPKKASEWESRLGKIWNIATQVFKLPLTADRAKKLKEYEIVSYNLRGGIYLGASFGLGFPEVPALDQILSLNTGVRTFVNGSHRISILKEKTEYHRGNYIRVRLTRGGEVGVETHFGSPHDSTLGDFDIIEGNVVWDTVAGLVKVKPYHFSLNKTMGRFYEAVYKFDLNSKIGRRAYENAVRGSFDLADTAAHVSKKAGTKFPPVSKLYTEKEKRKKLKIARSINLFLWGLNAQSGITRLERIVELDDGTINKYIETIADSIRKKNLLLGSFNEERSHKFTFNINLNKYNANPDSHDSLSLLVEGFRRDDITTPNEYLEYVNDLEGAVGAEQLYPRPLVNKWASRFKGGLGRLTLDYRLKFNGDQIKKFINTPEEEMWKNLTVAFNAEKKGWDKTKTRILKGIGKSFLWLGTIPLSATGTKWNKRDDLFVALLKYKRWKKLKIELKKGPKKLARALGKFFYTDTYGPEMAKLMRVSLKGEEFSFKSKIKTPLILENNILEGGGETRKFIDGTIAENKRKFELYHQGDHRVLVSGIKVVPDGLNHLILQFEIKETPKTVFFNLRRKDQVGTPLTNVSLVTHVVNNEKKYIKKGINKFRISYSNKEHFLYPLIDKMKRKRRRIGWADRYKLSIAGSLDGVFYGPTESIIFRYRIKFRDIERKLQLGDLTGQDFEIDPCQGKTGEEWITLLGKKKKFYICPDDDPRDNDFKCKNGIIPYKEKSKMMSLLSKKRREYNRKSRNTWLKKNCHLSKGELTIDNEKVKREKLDGNKKKLKGIFLAHKFISKLEEKKKICNGMNYQEIIREIEDQNFYICDKDSKAMGPKGFCLTGKIPYFTFNPIWIENDYLVKIGNIKNRDKWLKKNCPVIEKL